MLRFAAAYVQGQGHGAPASCAQCMHAYMCTTREPSCLRMNVCGTMRHAQHLPEPRPALPPVPAVHMRRKTTVLADGICTTHPTQARTRHHPGPPRTHARAPTCVLHGYSLTSEAALYTQFGHAHPTPLHGVIAHVGAHISQRCARSGRLRLSCLRRPAQLAMPCQPVRALALLAAVAHAAAAQAAPQRRMRACGCGCACGRGLPSLRPTARTCCTCLMAAACCCCCGGSGAASAVPVAPGAPGAARGPP